MYIYIYIYMYGCAFLAVRQTVACTVALLFVRVLVGLGAIGQELYAYVHMVTRESRISR